MFWDQFKQATCLPVMCGCELIRLDEWIRQPANFWSSVLYIALGIVLFRISKTFYQRAWSLLCVVLGLSSHVAHASFTQLAMSADFASIITLMVFPVQMHYLEKLGRSKNSLLTMLIFILIFGVMFYLGKIAKISICLAIFSAVLLYHFKNLRSKLISVLFIKSLLLMGLGFGFFILDELKVFCDSHSFFQFHSVWHLFTALALYYYGRWIFYSGKW